MLGAGYRTITYGRRGYGNSDKPAFGYDYNTAYRFMARPCWERGVLVVLDPVRWRDVWRQVRDNMMTGEQIDAENATHPVADPASQDSSGTGSGG